MISNYCEKFDMFKNVWRKIVSDRFSYTDELSECENSKNEGYVVLDFEPEDWWEILEHLSTIDILCTNNNCVIESDIVVPPQATTMTERLVRSISGCEHTATHEHSYSSHVHLICRSDITKVADIVDSISYIARKSEETIVE